MQPRLHFPLPLSILHRRAKPSRHCPFLPESTSERNSPSPVHRRPIAHAWTFLAMSQGDPELPPVTPSLRRPPRRLLPPRRRPVTVDSPPRPSSSTTISAVSFATLH